MCIFILTTIVCSFVYGSLDSMSHLLGFSTTTLDPLEISLPCFSLPYIEPANMEPMVPAMESAICTSGTFCRYSSYADSITNTHIEKT